MKSFPLPVFLFCLYCIYPFYMRGQSSGTVSPESRISTGDPGKEMLDIGSYPLLKRGTQYGMQSSYDRSGGNDDGFNGTYSILSHENGNSVIARVEGPGMITRIWFPCDRAYPDVPMGLRNKRIMVYLDGGDKPVIDLPIVELFNNTDSLSPYPLCGMFLGGCWCYIPIPFNKSAKLVVEGDKAFFFHVQYNQYSPERKIVSFSPEANPWKPSSGKLMDALWNPGDIGYLVGKDTFSVKRTYTLHPGGNDLVFPSGPAILRAFMINGIAGDLSTMLEGKLTIAWDGDKEPAVNTPLSLFFQHEDGGLNDRSLLAGTLTGGGVYNFFPMPYRRQAKVRIIVPRSCKLLITALFEKPPVFNPDLCYLHIAHRKENPTTPGKKFAWLDVRGQGHFAGVYLRAKGKSLSGDANGIVYWTSCLEGDEIFEVDGKMVEHGTGTEDYFNAGWNGLHGKLDHARVFPFHGFTAFDAAKDSSRIAAFRWHLPTEVIPFSQSFKAGIEVGPQDDERGDYESIAYYYLTRP